MVMVVSYGIWAPTSSLQVTMISYLILYFQVSNNANKIMKQAFDMSNLNKSLRATFVKHNYI